MIKTRRSDGLASENRYKYKGMSLAQYSLPENPFILCRSALCAEHLRKIPSRYRIATSANMSLCFRLWLRTGEARTRAGCRGGEIGEEPNVENHHGGNVRWVVE